LHCSAFTYSNTPSACILHQTIPSAPYSNLHLTYINLQNQLFFANAHEFISWQFLDCFIYFAN
jgi:hypothetical protein